MGLNAVNPQWLIAAECDAWESDIREGRTWEDMAKQALARLLEPGTTEANAVRLRGVIRSTARCTQCRETGAERVARITAAGWIGQTWGCSKCVESAPAGVVEVLTWV